jgi:voltage-gated potassium channel
MQSITKYKKITISYEVFITLLALVAVSLSLLDLTGKISIESCEVLYYTDLCILIIFSIDYVIRLILSNNKKEFFKQNILDLVAIIPFNSLFRAFRIVRLTRIFRITKISKLTKITRLARLFAFSRKFGGKIDKFVKTNGFVNILYLTITTIILGSVGIYIVEQDKTINSFGDAMWWSFVTTTTVGYGDISPVTILGRIIAAILMIVGIGFISMLTGTIATYFLNQREEKTDRKKYVKKIVDLSMLSEEEYKEVLNYIDYIKSKK